MEKIAIVVVNYNQLLKDCAVFKNEMMCDENVIFVVDNSTNEGCQKQNEKYCGENEKVVYISHKQNLGISKAYNLAINEIKKRDFQYILLLDADTEVADEYIKKIHQVIQTKDVDLILPIIRTQGGAIMSPCKKGNFGFFSNYGSVKEIEVSGKLSAINSGMCISRNIWNDYVYDENLFLDYVDHQFMNDFMSKSNKIYIMKEVEFVQNFSAESDDLQKSKFRFVIQMKDIEYYLQKNGYEKWCIKLHIWKRKIRIFIKNKKIEIFFW